MRNQCPLMLDLTERPCLVVGAGRVAERKINTLLQAGAAVTVISPEASWQIAQWAEEGRLCWQRQHYVDQPVEAYQLVIAATNDPAVNLRVHDKVIACGGWINIIDRPDLCNVMFPSVMQRGKLVISVSTTGASPSFARKVKKKLEQEYGSEYESYMEFLTEMRQRVMMEVSEQAERRRIFQQLLDERFVFATDEQRLQMATALLAEVRC